MHKNYTVLLSMQIEKNDDGYLASMSGNEGGFAEGDFIEEAVFNWVDVIKMIFTYRIERNKRKKSRYVPGIVEELFLSFC